MAGFAGFGLRWWRSFYDTEPALIGPLSKVNLLAGQNNAGKSNILGFAQQVVGRAGGALGPSLPATLPRFDHPVGRTDPVGLETLIAVRGVEDFLSLAADTEAVSRVGARERQEFEAILRSEAFALAGDDVVWLRYVPSDASRLDYSGENSIRYVISPRQIQAAITQVQPALLSNLSLQMLNQHSGHSVANLTQIFRQVRLNPLLPPVETIEAFRQVRSAAEGESKTSHSGVGLVQRLAELQNPDASDYRDREKFTAINDFLRMVLEDPTAQIDIPHHRGTINVSRGRELLPLSSLGTGIQQVVILAAAATMLEAHLVCVEEPEIHLHPLLQRKLIRYLNEKTSNTYLIATHSAHMLDLSAASVFHVRLIHDQGTVVSPVASPREQAAVCADLGYRPSDLVQANAVLWVEGPSDRIYVRRWLEAVAPDLVEGLHFSIMFYGGRLLNHLSANDPDVEEFISLRRLNRQISILIDSDKTGRGRRLNATKMRVISEFNDGPGLAWVTHGYGIENYLSPQQFHHAVRNAHPSGTSTWSGDRYENPLSQDVWSGSPKRPDKVAIARVAAASWPTDPRGWDANLRRAVQKLVAFIRAAN